jgi:hypothetical protein
MSGQRHECDCGAVYAHPDQVYACIDRNHGQLNRRRICGVAFGPEINFKIAPATKGLRYHCLLFENHGGAHARENPELDLSWGEEEYREYLGSES